MKKQNVFIFVLFLLIGQISYAQTIEEKKEARSKALNAIQLMDNGKIDESIILLKEAQKLDSKNFDYFYEMAYAYYIKQDYKKAIKILKKIKNHEDVSPRLFQLLGNSYDILSNSTKALEVYDQGLEKFPKSGFLYLEKGNVFWNKKEYEKALPYYEKGIEIDPNCSSNYYRATLIYCSSEEEMWGMIYGEIFLILESNSKRTKEISKLLFDTYKSQIKIDSDTSLSVSFTRNMITNLNSNSTEFKMPFGLIYEPTLMLSIISNQKTINLNSLNQIRTNFTTLYYQQKHQEKYPNVLFDYQQKMIEAGHFEAYNYWLLAHGNIQEFKDWHNANKEKFDAFVNWINKNGNELNLTDTNKFYKAQY